MNEFLVTIYPSSLPSNEKEQRLQDVLGFLLRSKKEIEGNRQVATERVTADAIEREHDF